MRNSIGSSVNIALFIDVLRGQGCRLEHGMGENGNIRASA